MNKRYTYRAYKKLVDFFVDLDNRNFSVNLTFTKKKKKKKKKKNLSTLSITLSHPLGVRQIPSRRNVVSLDGDPIVGPLPKEQFFRANSVLHRRIWIVYSDTLNLPCQVPTQDPCFLSEYWFLPRLAFLGKKTRDYVVYKLENQD